MSIKINERQNVQRYQYSGSQRVWCVCIGSNSAQPLSIYYLYIDMHRLDDWRMDEAKNVVWREYIQLKWI